MNIDITVPSIVTHYHRIGIMFLKRQSHTAETKRYQTPMAVEPNQGDVPCFPGNEQTVTECTLGEGIIPKPWTLWMMDCSEQYLANYHEFVAMEVTFAGSKVLLREEYLNNPAEEAYIYM